MNRISRILLSLAGGLVLFLPRAGAQESTVYATTIKSGIFIVGSQTPPAGVFFQHPSADTVWKHTGPLHTRGFAVDVTPATKGNIKYLASGSGLHKIDEAAGTWRTVTDWRITEVLDVTSAPSDPNTVYLACAYGAWHSNDGGTTWNESAQTTLKPGYTSKIIVDRSNEKRIYCAAYDGAFVSEDGAVTWKKLDGLTMHGILTIQQHPVSPNIFVVGTEDNGMYISSDACATWKKMEAGVDHSTFYAIAFDPQHPETMYAGGFVTGVYKSINGGASWRRMNDGLKDLNIHTIAVDPRESGRLYVGTYCEGVYRSDDGGMHWRYAGLPGAQVWDIKIIK
jgi:photosystem II stability/assembly factor-like uncharacterized protein